MRTEDADRQSERRFLIGCLIFLVVFGVCIRLSNGNGPLAKTPRYNQSYSVELWP